MSTPATSPLPQTGARLLVKTLEAQGVEYIFGVPGAKIDKVFDTLLDSRIKTVVCRHEQNATFIAGGIGGAVPIANRLKQVHQSMDTVSLFRPITKFSAEIDSPRAVSEVVANAFRAAESGRPGAAFISAPKDIMAGRADGAVLTPAAPVRLGAADANAIIAAASLLNT